MKKLILIAPLAAFALFAQEPQRRLTCEDRDRWDNRATYCEVKEWTVAASGRISVDSGRNGGISVSSWSRNEVLVRAKIQTSAPTEGEAKGMFGQVLVQTAGGSIHASAPEFGRDRGYAVSFEIFVPQRTDMALTAHNGGISISGVSGRIEFATQNGGVQLRSLAGTVKGHTVNGGLSVELAGSRWEGDQLDAQTTNGGVKVRMPDAYSARLELSTVNGGLRSDFDLGSGSDRKNVVTTLGSGGAPIRLRTTNGGISIGKV